MQPRASPSEMVLSPPQEEDGTPPSIHRGPASPVVLCLDSPRHDDLYFWLRVRGSRSTPAEVASRAPQREVEGDLYQWLRVRGTWPAPREVTGVSGAVPAGPHAEAAMRPAARPMAEPVPPRVRVHDPTAEVELPQPELCAASMHTAPRGHGVRCSEDCSCRNVAEMQSLRRDLDEVRVSIGSGNPLPTDGLFGSSGAPTGPPPPTAPSCPISDSDTVPPCLDPDRGDGMHEGCPGGPEPFPEPVRPSTTPRRSRLTGCTVQVPDALPQELVSFGPFSALLPQAFGVGSASGLRFFCCREQCFRWFAPHAIMPSSHIGIGTSVIRGPPSTGTTICGCPLSWASPVGSGGHGCPCRKGVPSWSPLLLYRPT